MVTSLNFSTNSINSMYHTHLMTESTYILLVIHIATTTTKSYIETSCFNNNNNKCKRFRSSFARPQKYIKRRHLVIGPNVTGRSPKTEHQPSTIRPFTQPAVVLDRLDRMCCAHCLRRRGRQSLLLLLLLKHSVLACVPLSLWWWCCCCCWVIYKYIYSLYRMYRT